MTKLVAAFRAALTFFCLLGGGEVAHGATFIQLAGDDGDYVLSGEQRFIVPAESELNFEIYSPNGIRISYFGPGPDYPFWGLYFAAANGSPLTEGLYERSRRLPSVTHPGLDVYGEGRGCNQTYGRFVVRELVRAGDGSIARFAADFEQHCERAIKSLFGGVRINSDIPYTPLPRMMQGATFITLAGPEGDFVLNGEQRDFDIADGNFSLQEEVQGLRFYFISRPTPFSFWMAGFGNASGQELTPGTYENAVGYPFQTAPNPGLSISGEGRACGNISGRFVIHELVREDDGLVLNFAADFEQHCSPGLPPLVGAVRFNSDVPYVPPPPPTHVASTLVTDQVTDITLLPGDTADVLRVRALDETGTAVPATRVRFSVASDCGLIGGLSSVEITADGDGYARAPAFTAGTVAGLCTVTASLEGGASIGFNFHIVEVGLAFQQRTILVTTGAQFTLNVNAVGSGGHPLAGVRISLQFDCTTGPACIATSQLAAVTDTNGQATFAATAGARPGSYSVTARSISNTAMANIVQRAGVGGHQDMWWAGSGENGWGMSIVQHDDKLFNVIYAYDDGGNPTWFVMPSGAWDETNTVYSGSIYVPHGAPYFAYDVSRFGSGAPVGAAKITFEDADNATLEYTISGQSGRKRITRQLFGPPSSQSAMERGDMWWGGGSQNGWGIAVLQQFSTLFSVWFTYDSSGSPTWFVLPSGTWTSPDMYEGRVYRTTGSPWVGRFYDASRLNAIDVGSFRLRFAGINAILEYTIDGRSGILSLERQPF